MLNCWCITWPVGFKIERAELTAMRDRPLPVRSVATFQDFYEHWTSQRIWQNSLSNLFTRTCTLKSFSTPQILRVNVVYKAFCYPVGKEAAGDLILTALLLRLCHTNATSYVRFDCNFDYVIGTNKLHTFSVSVRRMCLVLIKHTLPSTRLLIRKHERYTIKLHVQISPWTNTWRFETCRRHSN